MSPFLDATLSYGYILTRSVVLDFSPLQNDIKTNITYHSCTVEVNVVLYISHTIPDLRLD
jgi:hypothetical protein